MIKDPDINHSYCVISIAMLLALKYSLFYLLFLNTIIIILMVQNQSIQSQSLLYKALWILLGVPSFSATAILYLQIYEWISMVTVIREQKKKSLGEIMYEVNNSNDKFKQFKMKEQITRFVFVILTAFVYIFGGFAYFERHVQKKEKGFVWWFFVLIELQLPNAFLIITTAILLYHLWRYVNY